MTTPGIRSDIRTGADGRPWPDLTEAFRVWLRIALLSFGGPAGQIAVMHRILVDEKRWLGESRFLHALNFCMLLPGPEAQQLAVYVGWLMHRTIGGLIAGILFIAPGFLAIMLLSWIYIAFGDVPLVTWLFFGLKSAVLAIVLNAVVRIGRRALNNRVMQAIAAFSFLAIFVFGVPFPLLIAGAALIGFAGARWLPTLFANAGGKHGSGAPISESQTLLGSGLGAQGQPDSMRTTLLTGAILLFLWLLPTALLLTLLGTDNIYSNIAVFFSQMAVVTFGGAYAVLAYVAQAAVQTYGWLEPGEMLDGLGMAETTPGPLIIVTQFVGYLGAFRNPGGLPAWQAGALGAMLTTWVTFTPCFLWIFLGAPFVERLRSNQGLASALAAITAAVVGVVLNLAAWFALHTLFNEVGQFSRFGMSMPIPVLASWQPVATLLALLALIAVFYFRFGTGVLLMTCALAGIITGITVGV